MLNSKIPGGPLDNKWSDYKGHVNLVNPANKRKLEVIVVGTGLAGASAAATLGEMGYKVKAFCFQVIIPFLFGYFTGASVIIFFFRYPYATIVA